MQEEAARLVAERLLRAGPEVQISRDWQSRWNACLLCRANPCKSGTGERIRTVDLRIYESAPLFLALPIHKCEACRYRIPTYIGPGSGQREVYFTKCPLCGGRIGWELMRLSDSPIGPDGYPLPTPQLMRD
jgi:hypothetical protein